MAILRQARWLAAPAALLLSACASTYGNDFNPDALTRFVPGQTTLAEATVLMQGYPAQTYASMDGSINAVWTYKVSGFADLYYYKSASVDFAPDGTFRRILDTRGVIRDAEQSRLQLEEAAIVCPGPHPAAC